MKRVLKLLLVLMIFGGLSSCIDLLSCSKEEAEEEYDMLAILEKHTWAYDDGNVSLSVSFEDTSEHKEMGVLNWKRDELSVDIKVRYSNKTKGYSFKSDTVAIEKYRSGSIKGHDIRTVQSLISGAYADIHIHYNNDKDITFEFQKAILIRDPATSVKYPKPIPFVLPLYHLKPID